MIQRFVIVVLLACLPVASLAAVVDFSHCLPDATAQMQSDDAADQHAHHAQMTADETAPGAPAADDCQCDCDCSAMPCASGGSSVFADMPLAGVADSWAYRQPRPSADGNDILSGYFSPPLRPPAIF